MRPTCQMLNTIKSRQYDKWFSDFVSLIKGIILTFRKKLKVNGLKNVINHLDYCCDWQPTNLLSIKFSTTRLLGTFIPYFNDKLEKPSEFKLKFLIEQNRGTEINFVTDQKKTNTPYTWSYQGHTSVFQPHNSILIYKKEKKNNLQIYDTIRRKHYNRQSIVAKLGQISLLYLSYTRQIGQVHINITVKSNTKKSWSNR